MPQTTLTPCVTMTNIHLLLRLHDGDNQSWQICVFRSSIHLCFLSYPRNTTETQWYTDKILRVKDQYSGIHKGLGPNADQGTETGMVNKNTLINLGGKSKTQRQQLMGKHRGEIQQEKQSTGETHWIIRMSTETQDGNFKSVVTSQKTRFSPVSTEIP